MPSKEVFTTVSKEIDMSAQQEHLESEAIREALPWSCWSNNATVETCHKSLGALCEHYGFEPVVIESAIRHDNGKYGAFMIVHAA